MEWKDALTATGIFVSSVIAVASWFFVRHKDSEHEKFKIRLQKRLEITDAMTKYFASIHNNAGRNNDEWERLSSLVQVYGTRDEIRLIQQLGNDNIAVDRRTEILRELLNALVESVRRDIGYD